MRTRTLILITGSFLLTSCANVGHHKLAKHESASDDMIAHQRQLLAKNTQGKGFGPQAPRDIDSKTGINAIVFSPAPGSTKMNLCNIHFHKNAEHKGGEYTKYAGNGDGHGYQSGFQYSGQLSQSELTPVHNEICPSAHGSLHSSDTVKGDGGIKF